MASGDSFHVRQQPEPGRIQHAGQLPASSTTPMSGTAHPGSSIVDEAILAPLAQQALSQQGLPLPGDDSNWIQNWLLRAPRQNTDPVSARGLDGTSSAQPDPARTGANRIGQATDSSELDISLWELPKKAALAAALGGAKMDDREAKDFMALFDPKNFPRIAELAFGRMEGNGKKEAASLSNDFLDVMQQLSSSRRIEELKKAGPALARFVQKGGVGILSPILQSRDAGTNNRRGTNPGPANAGGPSAPP